MKKFFSFGKGRKRGLSPSGSDTGSVLSAGYELQDKELGKLHRAALTGELAKIKQLLKKQDINQQDKANRTPLHLACANGQSDAVTLLVESNAKVNLCDTDNRSPLMKAIQCQQESCASILLGHNADPNVVDNNGNAALHFAARIPSISIASQLLEHGADINAPTKEGCTPLMLAVIENNEEMVEFLIKEGANVNSKDVNERTPLMFAASNGHNELVKILLHNDADISTQDEKGWTADDHAVMNGHHACSHLIIEHSSRKKSSDPYEGGKKKKGASVFSNSSKGVEGVFTLGSPATDKQVTDDFSQVDSERSTSHRSAAADSWPSSDDDFDFSPQKAPKPNLKKLFHTKTNVNQKDSITSAQPVAFSLQNKSNSEDESFRASDDEDPPQPRHFPQAISFPRPMQFTPGSFAKLSQMPSSLFSLNKDDPSDDESDDKECSEFEDHIEGAAVKADLPSSLTEEKLQGAADPVGRKVTLMSELGLEEDDVESPWDSEASLDSPRKQSSSKLAHTSNEDLYYSPSFLSPSRNCKMPTHGVWQSFGQSELSKKSADVEINKQQTVSNILPAKDVSPKYPYVKASESNVKSDLMADLGLDDADDIEDVSDWDSTSHSPKYTTTTTTHKTERLTEDLPLEAKPRTTAPEPMTVDLSSSLPPVPQEEEEEEEDDDDDDDENDFDEKHVQSVLRENVLNSSKRDFKQMGENNDSLKKAVLTQVNHSAVVYQKENEKPQSVQMKPEGDDVCDSGKDVLKTPVTSDLQDKTKQMARQSQFKGKDGSKRTRKPLGIKIPDKQQKATTNGHLLDVYDDSTFSETSQEDNGRDDKFSNEKDKIDDGDEFDELSQSSDTTTDVTESPTFKNAMLLVEQLNVDGQDSLNLLKIQDIIRKYERSLQKENGRYSLLLRKVKKMESNHKDLQQITEKNRELKSVLDHQKLEWESDLNHLRFMLKQEEEKRKSADILYEKSREQLRKKEDQCCKEMEDKQQLEMTVRNMERELRSLSNNVKQAEEERNEAQRLLSQERNARVLQEDFLNNLRRKNEEEEAAKIILSKSVEVHSQPSETTERVKDLSQRNHALEEEITLLKQELEKVQCQNEEEKRQYLDENEVLKEKVDDLKKDLKINEEALTQNLIQYNGQLNALKTEATIFCTKLEHEKQAKERLETELESFRSRLNSTQQEQEKSQMLKTEVERTFQRERDEWMRSKDKLDHELSSIRENNKNLSQQLSRAEAKSNELECDLHRRGLSFQEKVVLLESTQRDLTQAQCRIKELESTLQTEKDQINKNTIILESRQERLAQIQSENMQLRQQLEDMQSKGIFKDKLVTDAQDKFTDIFSKLRADTERQVHLVEERNKDLINKSNELREQVYRLETEKVEGESARRQLQQELADAFKKLSMSEASLEVITRYRNDLEEEKQNLQKEVEKCRNKLQDLEDQFIQSERLNHQLKNLLDDKEREIVVAIQKAQEFSTATAAAEKSAKQLEEHVQKLEIENAKIEATAKHQTTQIEILQRELQESISNRNRMEDLLTGLQSSKMGLEEKLNQQVSKQTALSMNAHESHSMWEEELKSRSRLGIRLAELDREKADLVEQVDRERKKVKKLAEMKKSVESRFDQEVKRNSELHRDLTGMKKLLKTTKKKLKEFESLGHQQSRPEDGSAHKNIESDSERSRLKDKVEQLSVSLERESMRYKQLESASRDLQEQLYSMKHLHRKHERQEKGQRHLEGEVADLKRHLESSKMDQSTMENFKREIEERGRQELQQKLEEVNLFLQTQAAAQDSLEQIRSANDASLRSQLESRIQDLESELHRIKTQQKERECQKESSLTELDRFKDLYAEEMKLRKVLASKLERTSEKLEEANTKLLTERQRSKSLIASSIVNGSLATSPILDSSQLGLHARNLAMNGGFGLGGSFLSSTGNGLTVNRIDSYLAQMHHDLEKSIAKELQQGNSELETGYTRVPPVGSTAATLRNPDTDLDPVSRTAQQYLEVLKKNYMI